MLQRFSLQAGEVLLNMLWLFICCGVTEAVEKKMNSVN